MPIDLKEWERDFQKYKQYLENKDKQATPEQMRVERSVLVKALTIACGLAAQWSEGDIEDIFLDCINTARAMDAAERASGHPVDVSDVGDLSDYGVVLRGMQTWKRQQKKP